MGDQKGHAVEIPLAQHVGQREEQEGAVGDEPVEREETELEAQVREEEDAEPLKEEDLILGSDTKLVEDYKGNQLLLFGSQWAIDWTAERNKNLTLREFGGGTGA